MRRVLAIGLLAITIAGCSSGGSGYVSRSNHTCAETRKTISKLKAPTDAKAGLAYALDRYVAVEQAVSTLTDSSLPGGSAGRDLRDRWLRPARASLEAADADLNKLRDAARSGDRSAASSAFTAASAAGTAGVDTGLLRSRSLTTCAELFTASTPAADW